MVGKTSSMETEPASFGKNPKPLDRPIVQSQPSNIAEKPGALQSTPASTSNTLGPCHKKSGWLPSTQLDSQQLNGQDSSSVLDKLQGDNTLTLLNSLEGRESRNRHASEKSAGMGCHGVRGSGLLEKTEASSDGQAGPSRSGLEIPNELVLGPSGESVGLVEQQPGSSSASGPVHLKFQEMGLGYLPSPENRDNSSSEESDYFGTYHSDGDFPEDSDWYSEDSDTAKYLKGKWRRGYILRANFSRSNLG